MCAWGTLWPLHTNDGSSKLQGWMWSDVLLVSRWILNDRPLFFPSLLSLKKYATIIWNKYPTHLEKYIFNIMHRCDHDVASLLKVPDKLYTF